MSIYDEENKLVKTLIDEFKAEGSHQIVWDGTDSIGNQAPDGKYYFQFSSYDGPIDSNAFFLMPGDWSSEVVEARTSASDSDENTYEVDFSNQAVHKYDQTATLLFSTTGQNVGLDAFEPTAIVLDINDNLFIIDRNLARIFKLNRHGYSLNELPYPADNSWADRTIGFDEPDAVSLDRNGDLLVANQNGNEILKLAVGRGVIEISNITAEIRVPYEDSLLSATIPIIGTASARGFDRYTVEIGAGESPTVWSTLVTAHAEVFDDRKPLPPSRTLYGNLASWHTSRVPMGTYTIRLTVYNRTGSFKQDRVTVEVADLVGRRGSTVISNDGVVTFEIPSGGIADDYDLFSIKALEIGEAPPVSDPDLILLGNIYEFRPPRYQFLKDCTLKMYYTDEQLGDVDENTLKIYRWNPLIQRWIFVFADLDTADNVLTTTLSALNDYKVYYAIIADPPPAPVIFQPASPTNLKSISVYGRATPSVSVEVLVDGESQGITRADENTGNFVLHGVQLSEGDNIFTAKAFDPVGNTSPQSAPVLVQVVLTQPTDVTSVAFKTSDFLADLSGDVAVGDFLYIELIGIDADAASIDSATVTVASSVTDPGGISVQLLETAVDSGIYRGTARIGETTDGLAGTIGVSVAISETISAVSDVDPIKQDTVNTADAILPPAPTITSPTHPSLCQNTFEADSGEWANMSNQYGASVERSAIAASTGSYSIKLVNTEPGGDFANYIRTTPYDARHYPIVSFDYKIPEGVKVNMVAFVNGMWKEIVFTDDPKTVETFDEDLYRTIGYIEGVVRDNSWHHVGFNLYNMLKNDDPEQTEYIVEELFFSDYNLPGWMELIMGEENAGGAAYYIDNFIITEGGKSSDNPTFIWQPNDASVVAYSYVLDQNPETVPDQLSEGASNSATYSNIGDGVWYFHVRSLDGGGNWGPANHYQIVIDANGPVADSPVPEDGSSSGSLEVRCRITDVGGSGVNPDSIRFDLDGTVHDMASGGLAFDEETGILTFSLWKVFPVPDPWLDGETIQASLIAVEDFAGNPLQEIISWSWIVDYSQLAGGYLSLLTTQGGFTPTWCPNGTRIAFMSERSGNQDIWVIDADDYAELAGTAQQLTFGEANDHHPAWSPVDDRIAFVSDRDGYGHIWVINADRTGLMQLTTGDYDDSHPTWSPDGQTIAFSRGGEIWKMDADGSNEAQVTYESVEWNLEPVWSPDGSKVAFTKSLYMDQVAVMDADEVNKKALTQSGRDILPTWSKQTDQVIFVTRRDEKTNSVWIMNSNGSNEDVYIDNEGMWWDSEPAQSPVNEEVAFQSTRNGVWNIWVKTTLQVADFAASPDPFSPNEDGIKDTVDIKFNLLKGAAKIDLKIYDAANNLILTLLDQQLGVAGENIVVWNGTDDNGNTVADGTYTFRIFVTGSAGSASIEKSGTISVDTTAPQFSDWTVPEIYGAVSEDVDIAVKVSDNSALNTSATKLQYAIASSADMTNPDTLGWTDFGSGSNGTLNLRWSNYAGFYLYIRAFAEDDLGNVNYSDVQKQLISLAISRRTTIQLKEGFNLISIPAEIAFAPELQEWLAFIGGVDQVDKVMVYDADGGRFITIEPGQDTNPSFVMRGGEGLIVYAKQNSDITFNNVLCSNPNYKRGFNFAGIACPAFGYSAFEFLTDLANENISSIQRYSTEKGYFETAGFDSNGQPVGIDFPIVPGEGYFVYAGERQPCFDNTVCESAEFCEKPLGECAGGGFCTPRPQNCPALWDPVCGCDDIVYGNACEAAATGVSLAHKGSCKAGGPCEYNDITGMATIVSVFEPGASENNCPNNPKKVIFNFVPDDPLAADNYLHPGWPDENIVLMIGAGMNPSNDWIMEEGLTEGTQHVCLRREITAGSCTPVIFEFTNVDYDRANELCSP